MSTPNRPPLSPAAQAVLDAAEDDCIHPVDRHRIAAAALRAAADAVVNPDDYEPACVFDKDYWDAGFSAAVQTIREQLLAIATELEGTPRDPLEPNDLSHLSDEEFLALAPQGFHGV